MKCACCCCLAIICQLISHSLHCQFYFSSNNRTEPELLWELGAAAGAMNCLTDIGGNKGKGSKFIKDINWNQTQLACDAFVSATWHYLFSVRLQAAMGHASGNDQVLNNSTGAARNRYLRNLQFTTSIAEATVSTELYPLIILDKNRSIPLLSPYLIAGVGCFHYNPKAWLKNEWIDLRPLHTEGEGFREYPGRHTYSSFSWCAPVGAGIKYDAAGFIDLRLEILYRFTGTDYLDDVSTRYIDPSLFSKYLSPAQSQLAVTLADRSGEITTGAMNANNAVRGNPTNRDAYFSFMISISIVLGRVAAK